MPYKLSFYVFLFIFLILSIVQLKVTKPMLLTERFWTGSGWIEIFIVALYGAIVVHKMHDPKQTPIWRRRIWLVFTTVFFAQLVIGLLGYTKFLMTGTLHFPIPMMIVSGPLFRAQLSFMTILFLSTVLLSGPAWCSQLCYFGGLDAFAAKNKTNARPIKNKMRIKYTGLFLVVSIALLLRWLRFSLPVATILASLFGLGGLYVILFFSRKRNKMYHCILYCPIGTIINYLKFINPFRMYIDNACDGCMKCSTSCKYDALSIHDIRNKKPGLGCTMCGDCLPTCKTFSIHYKFMGLNSSQARNLYLFITVSLHAIFMALGRI